MPEPLDLYEDLHARWKRGVEAIERGGYEIERGAYLCQTVIIAFRDLGWDAESIGSQLNAPVTYVTSTLRHSPFATDQGACKSDHELA